MDLRHPSCKDEKRDESDYLHRQIVSPRSERGASEPRTLHTFGLDDCDGFDQAGASRGYPESPFCSALVVLLDESQGAKQFPAVQAESCFEMRTTLRLF